MNWLEMVLLVSLTLNAWFVAWAFVKGSDGNKSHSEVVRERGFDISEVDAERPVDKNNPNILTGA